MFKEEPSISTHWEGCEEAHPECKIAKLEKKVAELESQLEDVAKWISVKEGLPNLGEAVLVIGYPGRVVSIACREDLDGDGKRWNWAECSGYLEFTDEGWFPDDCKVIQDALITHWLRIPPPPSKPSRIRRKYIQKGGKTLSAEELDEEIQSRR
jgi:hypothetical protein